MIDRFSDKALRLRASSGLADAIASHISCSFSEATCNPAFSGEAERDPDDAEEDERLSASDDDEVFRSGRSRRTSSEWKEISPRVRVLERPKTATGEVSKMAIWLGRVRDLGCGANITGIEDSSIVLKSASALAVLTRCERLLEGLAIKELGSGN